MNYQETIISRDFRSEWGGTAELTVFRLQVKGGTVTGILNRGPLVNRGTRAYRNAIEVHGGLDKSQNFIGGEIPSDKIVFEYLNFIHASYAVDNNPLPHVRESAGGLFRLIQFNRK